MEMNIESLKAQISNLRAKGHAALKKSRGWKFGGDRFSAQSENLFRQANALEDRNWLLLHPEDATPENIAQAKELGLPCPV